jgi:hypothetical protein
VEVREACRSGSTGHSRTFAIPCSALTDPRVQALPPPLFKFWFNLLCLAYGANDAGRLPDDAGIAAVLRTTPAAAATKVMQLVAARLLVVDPDGVRRDGLLRPKHQEPAPVRRPYDEPLKPLRDLGDPVDDPEVRARREASRREMDAQRLIESNARREAIRTEAAFYSGNVAPDPEIIERLRSGRPLDNPFKVVS